MYFRSSHTECSPATDAPALGAKVHRFVVCTPLSIISIYIHVYICICIFDSLTPGAPLPQTLPHYVPKTTVSFSGGLHETVTKEIELSNPSRKPVRIALCVYAFSF